MKAIVKLFSILFIFLHGTLVEAADIELSISAPHTILQKGRLHIVFSKDENTEPRFYSAFPMPNVEPLFSVDLNGIVNNVRLPFDAVLTGFPHTTLSALPEGEWYVQAIYDTDFLDSRINSSKNWYSNVSNVTVEASGESKIALELVNQIGDEAIPKGDQHLQFVKMQSKVLSSFWKTDMYLRAAVLLPASYYDNPLKEYPVIFNIGGYHSRYDRAERLYENETFKSFWFSDKAPQMVIVYLDGEAPYGDSYQIDSANNGPYGEATWQELLPFLSKKYNLVNDTKGRFVTGCSTGGWVSLALQTYYPDLFNGAWSFSADGVDFTYFQLVDIYNDNNAFVSEHGTQRPSYKAKDGEIIFSIKREIMMENAMGRNNSYVYSGGQWGGWNAVYSPKQADGAPAAIWDPATGEINKDVAAQWQKFDLRQYTQDNWQTLGPKLKGKLHIWMGDLDGFYLNNAMHLYEEMHQQQTEPKSDASFTWERGAGHCDYNRTEMLEKVMNEMNTRFLRK